MGQRLEQVVLSDQHVGEGLRHFQAQPGDLLVADSAYCRRQALFEHLDAGVEVLTRLHWSSTPLLCADGRTPFALSAWLQTMEPSGEGETSVLLQVRKRQRCMRLIAHHLSAEPAKRAHRKRKTTARKSGRRNQDLTIQIADWLVVLTSLDAKHWRAEQVLALYRTRWQIELLFARIKQMVRLHRLGSVHLQSNQAVLAAGPTEPQSAPLSTWGLCAILLQSLRTMIPGCWSWAQIRASLAQMAPLLRVHPQNRPHQESEMLASLTAILLASCQGGLVL